MSDHNEEKIIFDLLQHSGDAIGTIRPTRTIIHIGNGDEFNIHLDKKFNRFQKKMINWCFGWEVEDVDET